MAADQSVIAWGPTCQNGELGFGEGDKKSSAKPKKVDSLEASEGAAFKVAQVACGVAHSVLLCEYDAAVVDKLPEWSPAPPAAAAAGGGKAAGKRKAEPKPPAGKKTKK